MPIIKPMTYYCKECDWSAVKLQGDVLLTTPGSSKCPSCGGELDEKLGSFLDMVNLIKRIRGLQLETKRSSS